MSNYVRNDDGTLTPAEPIGWREEHNLWQRFMLWATRVPHCSTAETATVEIGGQRMTVAQFDAARFPLEDGGRG